ncbi:2Fe-2S iron-sulfur cluster-binding protein [Sulfurovum sp. zt1-1]|uniref:2Fe-2S iron-sulfur cluster-binding protein n=1 Tax=Sulfurovum zhangzhouensis TaxID=3019067 RepID=A0ABT7QYW4_9BACT|nr:2Fe-2S iron-sulfur cluster-binding protein [Sulfurovum zhangzhouensis]MDM5271491.1 2Fe-2S iron-sulfur cluster-binding protein [Sulfurovum zhangzhouensis]
MNKHNSLGLGKEISITINGKKCKSTFGKTILEIARENGIYIPTMCYLTKTLPIASCRMCLVSVEGVDGAILSCQEKATDGAVVTTQTSELYQERQNIMKLYNVNHPLECGVCDQSGECDLQNKTLEFDVGNQNFTARDQHRPVENWGHVSYDPALCIMCEKCVRVSTEITGDEALQLKFGGYSSTIVNVKKEKNYASLGEAAAVCPVGALVDTDFKYRTNAWELTKIPSSCSHCGGGCQMDYEVKKDKIYRVSNNAEFSTLCGAGRYGFDYANEGVSKDKEAFENAVDAVANAHSILFAPQISNEEALILQKIKEKQGTKLICHEARAYQKFMRAYGSITGKNLFGGTLDRISESRGVIVFGTRINDDAPNVKYHINMASKWHRSRVAYLHPMRDEEMKNIVTQFMQYIPGSEEAVAAQLVLTLLGQTADMPQKLTSVLEELNPEALAAQSSVSSDQIAQLQKSLVKKQGFSLVVGSDLYAHPRAENIAKLIALLERYAGFNVVCVPPAGNAMGVSLICDLDDECEGMSVGYNVQGDFTLSALGEGDLDMPAMNQQEGTLTSNDKRVVPMNVAKSYDGYVLNDIANALGLEAEYTIEYTASLPEAQGFRQEAFDDLPDYFDITGEEHRGYLLSEVKVPVDQTIETVESTTSMGSVVYQCNPAEQFSPFTAKCEAIASEAQLVGSIAFANETGLNDGQNVSFEIDGVTFNRVFKIDTSMSGNIALNPSFDMGLSAALISSYRFKSVDFSATKNEEVGS